MGIFKEQSIKDTQVIVDSTYENWMLVKSENDIDTLNVLSDVIYMCYKADIRDCTITEKEDYWFDVFKDEKL